MAFKRCDKCGKEDKIKNLKKVNGNSLCEICYKKKIKKRREEIEKDILGITEEQKIKENREIINKYNREYYEKKRQNKNYISKKKIHWKDQIVKPKIKGTKEKSRGRYHYKGMYLSKTERDFLYKKYRKNGYDSFNANKKVKEIVEYLSNKIIELREKGKSEKDIDRIFKEEFAKLIENNVTK